MFKVVNEFELKQLENEIKNSYLGVVYILQYGENVKIGSTNQPFTRYKTLKHNAEDYGNVKIGKISLSEAHTNYRRNESELHKIFRDYRRLGTELFNISFDNAIEKLGNIELEFLNDSKEISLHTERSAKALFDCVFNGKNCISEDENIDDEFIRMYCCHLEPSEKKFVRSKLKQKRCGEISTSEFLEVIFYIDDRYKDIIHQNYRKMLLYN